MENLYQEIGARISILRKGRGITQEKLAEELDVTIKHISEIERGLSSLSLPKLVHTAQFLDCSMDFLILGRDKEVITSLLPDSILEVLESNDKRSQGLLDEYLRLFSRLRGK